MANGHLQVRGNTKNRRWHAFWRDAAGKHQKVLGPAHVKDSGRRTDRGAVIWRVGDGPKPTSRHLTPKEAQQALDELLVRVFLERADDVPCAPIRTLGEARAEWLRHVEFDRARRPSTVRDYATQTRLYVIAEFGEDCPLDEITTERIEEWQQELLERGQLSRRTIQKAQVVPARDPQAREEEALGRRQRRRERRPHHAHALGRLSTSCRSRRPKR